MLGLWTWPAVAIIHMYDVISQYEDGGVVLVATGALTNVALLLLVFPEIKSKLSHIVLMGGALGIGNTGPVAEFNIQVKLQFSLLHALRHLANFGSLVDDLG